MRVSFGGIVKKLVQGVRKHWFGFLAGFLIAVVCFIAVSRAAERFSTSGYCGGKCHEMRTAYRTWELSVHFTNDSGVVAECIACHLPSEDRFFTHMAVKTYVGAKDVYKHYFGGEYDPEKMRKKVLDSLPNERCLNCHSNLPGKAGSSAARIAHQAVLNPTDDFKPRCVDCHQKLHEREREIFSVD
ncbi:MAG: cytochrome c3 family protein [Planctomycetota bacterium]|jgi:nitrate/TMAO reductase-like tetraheme cytochrome c subunit